MCTLKNLEESWKTSKSLEKTSGNPVCHDTKIIVVHKYIIPSLVELNITI